MISKCSGETASETAMASSTPTHATAKPALTAGAATPAVGSTASCFTTSASTASMTAVAAAMSGPNATRIGRATTSCSACASRSAATVATSAVASQTTRTSLGPASMSMPTLQLDETTDLAAVTHFDPGPQITSHLGTPGSAPVARTQMACAPPTARRKSAPATCAAASVTARGFGVATTTVLHPAARAVIAVISTDDGSG
mmetsp:Transcript_4438/g.14014  ORF Transcript_4438/g.14014 Transcript_4438/m.14014 type:complete len:201 (-) Transcript_4438:467-1069(-)